MISICEDTVKENPSGFLTRDVITPATMNAKAYAEWSFPFPSWSPERSSFYPPWLPLPLRAQPLGHTAFSWDANNAIIWWLPLGVFLVLKYSFFSVCPFGVCTAKHLCAYPKHEADCGLSLLCSLCIFNSSPWVCCPDGPDVCRMNGMTWSRGLRVGSGMNLHLYKAAETSVLTRSWFLL